MWTALTLVGVLAAANGYSDQVTISNVRLTRGLLGPEREDNKVIVGDSFFIAFDIEGLKADDTGRVRYNLAMEATDSKGNVVYTQRPRDLEAINALGGSRVPAFTSTGYVPVTPPRIQRGRSSSVLPSQSTSIVRIPCDRRKPVSF